MLSYLVGVVIVFIMIIYVNQAPFWGVGNDKVPLNVATVFSLMSWLGVAIVAAVTLAAYAEYADWDTKYDKLNDWFKGE